VSTSIGQSAMRVRRGQPEESTSITPERLQVEQPSSPSQPSDPGAGTTSCRIQRVTSSRSSRGSPRPYWPLHIVVIPKRHVPSLTDLGGEDQAVLTTVMDVVRSVAADVEREHGAARVLTNLGAYQDSKHLHFHVTSGEPLRR
jgi:histidine triad (HIT) family protein